MPADDDASVVEGEYFVDKCYGSLCGATRETLRWKTPNEPEMSWQHWGPQEACKYQFCMDTWTGFRGRSKVETDEHQISYDQSWIHRPYDAWRLYWANCAKMQNTCCEVLDAAPRFARAEDIRAVVAQRYDWEMSRRHVGEPADPLEFNLREGNVFPAYPLPRAHDVAALYTARLYHDVKCCFPMIRWGNTDGVDPSAMAANDVRYRGSDRHGKPTDEDHLIVLAGLILNLLHTFPASNSSGGGCAYAVNVGPQGNVRRGRLVPRATTTGKV